MLHASSQVLFELDRGASAYDDADALDDGAPRNDDAPGRLRNSWGMSKPVS